MENEKFEKNFPTLYEVVNDPKPLECGDYDSSISDSANYFNNWVKAVNKHCLDKQRVNEWFKKKSSKPRAECQDCRRQLEARQKRLIVRELWNEFDKELGLKDE